MLNHDQLWAAQEELATLAVRQKDLEADVEATLGRQEMLDAAFAAVNVLGGYVDPTDKRGVAADEILTTIIEFIADLGGMDPADRKHWRG